MGNKGQFGFGIMAIASAVLIIVVIVITLILVYSDMEKRKEFRIEAYDVSVDSYFLHSLIRTKIDENLNIADVIALSVDDEEDFVLLEDKIHKILVDSDFFYSFGFEYKGVKHTMRKPGWVALGDIKKSFVFIPAYDGGEILVVLGVAEGEKYE